MQCFFLNQGEVTQIKQPLRRTACALGNSIVQYNHDCHPEPVEGLMGLVPSLNKLRQAQTDKAQCIVSLAKVLCITSFSFRRRIEDEVIVHQPSTSSG